MKKINFITDEEKAKITLKAKIKIGLEGIIFTLTDTYGEEWCILEINNDGTSYLCQGLSLGLGLDLDEKSRLNCVNK